MFKTEWMFCDLKKFKTISDLAVKIKERYDIRQKSVNLLLDDAILPNQETIEILNSGDLVKVDIFQKKPNAKTTKISKKSSSDSSSSSSSSTSSSEGELENLEQSFKGIKYVPKMTETSKKRKLDEDNSESDNKKKACDETLQKEDLVTQPVPDKPKRKRKRKNKNKNKLPQENVEEIPKELPKPKTSFKPNISSQAKITKFNDSDDEGNSEDTGYTEPNSTNTETTNEGDIHKDHSESKKSKSKKNKKADKITDGDHEMLDHTSKVSDPQELGNNYKSNEDTASEASDMQISGKTSAQIFSPYSSTMSCEDILLGDMKHNAKIPNGAKNSVNDFEAMKDTTKNQNGAKNPVNGLEALLKLAKKPIKAKAQQNRQQKMAKQDVCSNRSVIFINKEIEFEPDKLDQYPIFDLQQKPEIGQILAFMCLQIGPDYTPQMTRYVGELKQIDENGTALFLIMYDENEGKNPSEKFEIDARLDGLLLKNREVDFQWSQLSDIRKIK